MMKLRLSGRRKGVALILTLFFMILLYAVASSYYVMIPAEMRSAVRLQDDAEAFYVADSGISDALAQMEYQVNTDSNNFENYTPTGTFWVSSNGVAPVTAATPNPSSQFLNAADARQLVANKTYATAVTARLSYEVVLERWAFKQGGLRVPDAYRVVSRAVRDRGTSTSRLRRTVTSWCIQKNFANYAYFVDRLPSDIWLDLNSFRIDGPYHTNNRVMLSAPSSWSDAAGSAFRSQLSMPQSMAYTDPNLNRVVDGVRWNSYSANGLPYNPTTGVINGDRYQRVIDGGVERVHQTAAPIQLPSDSGRLESAAFGSTVSGTLAYTASTSAFGTASSVNLHVPTASSGATYPAMGAGLYFQGNLDQVTLSAPTAGNGNAIASDDNTNAVMSVTQGSYTTNITSVYETLSVPSGALINGSTSPTSGATTLRFSDNNVGYTVVRDGTSNRYRIYQGVGNGAIYVDGNINGIRGVNRGRKTIATATDSGSSTANDKKIWINGPITRADTPVIDPATGRSTGTAPTGVRDQIGLVSYAVRMKRDDVTNPFVPSRSGSSATAPVLLYAAIFAGRGGDPNATSNSAGGGMGTDNYDSGTGGHFSLFGSLTEGTRQVKGTFGGNNGGTGYSYEYHYDTNFSATAPPFFPGTSGFRMASWTEDAVRQE
ncbi:MAG: pilus assembly PilX N-terminal domain-containing protein [Candidatus Eremiobacteraeota bacterium]|nr:pilus assembly PilX N-terminal domain-containing protein [Candidatus Eremiobacteraeota bacterium]